MAVSRAADVVASPQERRQNFSMLETASTSHSDDGKAEPVLLPYHSSDRGSASSMSSVNFADSLVVGGKRLPSSGGAAALDLLARGNVGLLLNYAAVGAVHGLFQALLYPYLNVYLNMDDYLAYSAERWLELPWLFKIFLAMVSDGLPIKGSRRRAYMFLGWSICLLFSLVLSALPVETPYLTDGAVTNSSAAQSGKTYVALFAMATVGYVFADVACDGMMVELAHLHQATEPQVAHGEQTSSMLSPFAVVGPTQVVATLFAVRYLSQFAMVFFVGFMCSSDSYGGNFGWGASVNGMTVIAVLVSAGGIAATWFLLQEDESPAGYNVHVLLPREWRRALDRLLHQRAVVQLMGYIFLSRLCFTYYATSAKAVYEYWVPAGVLTTSIFSSLNAAVFAGAALLLSRGESARVLLHLGWQKIVGGVVCFSTALLLLLVLFTVFNVIRSAVLTLLVEQIIVAFEALAYFVALLAAVETAEPGLECTSFSLLSTSGNLAVPFAISLSQSIGAYFDVYDSEYEADSGHARTQVLYCFLVVLFIRLLHLAVLPLLPDRAQAARALKLSRLRGLKGKASVVGALVCLGFLLFWAVLTTSLSSFERTSCLTVAGGEGC